MESAYLLVITTLPDEASARQIASALVAQRLAACVQVSSPITSVYRWQGREESSVEYQVTAKTRADLYEHVERAIRELHSYEVPEILAVPIAFGSQSYLAWLNEQLIPPAR